MCKLRRAVLNTSEPSHPRTVAVIGGGVSGITTALALQLSGISTALYVREDPTDDHIRLVNPPELASIHAAASILPHSVNSSNVGSWLQVSQRVFQALAFSAVSGVRKQTHYEMFETAAIVPPDYQSAMDNFVIIGDDEVMSSRAPRRSANQAVRGWCFDAYFCESATYLRYLYSLYCAVGGRVLLTASLGLDEHLLSYLESRLSEL